jgi:hypothetical protein
MDFTDRQNKIARRIAEHWGYRAERNTDAISRLVLRLYRSLNNNADLYKTIILKHIESINADSDYTNTVSTFIILS